MSHEHHGVLDHRPRECLFNILFGLTSKKRQMSASLGLCEGIPLVTGRFPSQRANNVDIFFMAWNYMDAAWIITQITWLHFKIKWLDKSVWLNLETLVSDTIFCYFQIFISTWSTCFIHYLQRPLQWRHNECDGVSNHRYCLFNRLFRRRSKKASKLWVTGLFEGNPPVTGGFPSERASNAENVSIWWRHHG